MAQRDPPWWKPMWALGPENAAMHGLPTPWPDVFQAVAAAGFQVVTTAMFGAERRDKKRLQIETSGLSLSDMRKLIGLGSAYFLSRLLSHRPSEKEACLASSEKMFGSGFMPAAIHAFGQSPTQPERVFIESLEEHFPGRATATPDGKRWTADLLVGSNAVVEKALAKVAWPTPEMPARPQYRYPVGGYTKLAESQMLLHQAEAQAAREVGASAVPATPRPVDETPDGSGLELDLDRSWRKK
jgi:hypothetical protein